MEWTKVCELFGLPSNLEGNAVCERLIRMVEDAQAAAKDGSGPSFFRWRAAHHNIRIWRERKTDTNRPRGVGRYRDGGDPEGRTTVTETVGIQWDYNGTPYTLNYVRSVTTTTEPGPRN